MIRQRPAYDLTFQEKAINVEGCGVRPQAILPVKGCV